MRICLVGPDGQDCFHCLARRGFLTLGEPIKGRANGRVERQYHGADAEKSSNY